MSLSIIGASADKNCAFNWVLYLGSTISSCSLSGSPRDGQVSPVTCSLRGESRNAQTQFAKPYGGSAVWLSARAPIMHTKMAVITSLRFYFFQFLDTIFCVIFQNPPTFEATSRRSFEGRTHPHQRKETVLSHKYNAFCLVSLNFEHFLSLLDLNLSRYRSGIWSFYFLLLKNYTAGVKNTSTMYTYKC